LSHTPALFALGYFSDRISHFFSGLLRDFDPLTYTSFLSGITETTTTLSLFVEMESHKLFAPSILKL
jgi:hypothetical protein